MLVVGEGPSRSFPLPNPEPIDSTAAVARRAKGSKGSAPGLRPCRSPDVRLVSAARPATVVLTGLLLAYCLLRVLVWFVELV